MDEKRSTAASTEGMTDNKSAAPIEKMTENISERDVMTDAETLDDISGMIELGSDNAHFSRRGDFLALELDTATAERIARRRAANAMPGAEDSFSAEELRRYDRVSLRRAFPFDVPDSYISVFDANGIEIGMVAELSELEPDQSELLRAGLDVMPHVRRIGGIANKRGMQLWRLDTDAGEIEISVRDATSSLIKTSGGGVIILDQSGNRYEIKDIAALDSASRRRLDQCI